MTRRTRQKLSSTEVVREFGSDAPLELLKLLHLVTRGGDLNADALRKFKQVNHLLAFFDDVFAGDEAKVVVDFGSGSAYLGFLLYHRHFAAGRAGRILSIEREAPLRARAEERAQTLGYTGMQFLPNAAELPAHIDLMVALHACDTATDEALLLAVQHQVRHIALVPCCQAEVARQLKEARDKLEPGIQALISHPLHCREFGSHLTNVLRGLVLQAQGYSVMVTELTGIEHSFKNELIWARRVGAPNNVARARLDELCRLTGVRPSALRALSP